MADTTYRNLNPKYDDTRYKVNNAIIRMMNANPTLGIGYLIGNAIGENYFGKKRNNTGNDTEDAFYKEHGMEKGSAGANKNNEAGRSANAMSPMERRAQIMTDMRDYLKSQGKTSGTVRPSEVAEWKARNDILNNMGGNNAPKTPQQNNTSGVTVGNAGNGGGVSSVADGWNKMANGSGYNPGNTTMFTNGTRDLGNVIGADANGEFGRMAGLHPGVIIDTARGIYPAARPGTYIDTSRGIYMDSSQSTPSAAPQATTPAGPGYGDVLGLKKDGVYFPMNHPNPAPIPYTAEQLAQIQAQGYSPEELRRMGAVELIAPQVQASAPAQSGGLLSAVTNAAQAVPTAVVPEEQAAAMDRRTMFVPEEEAGLAEARLVANNLSRAAATPATATDYNGRFITPGHDDSLTWNAIFGGSNYNNPKAQAMALEYLKNMPG